MKLLLRSILFFAVTVFATSAQAQFTIWNNNGSTDFGNPANWNNGVPGPGIDAYVVPDGIADSSGGFFVTQGGDTNIVITSSTNQTSDGLFITNDVEENLVIGTVTMTFASGTTYNLNIVGVEDGETLNFSGNLTAFDGVEVGTADGGVMTFTSGTLDDSLSDLTIGGDTGTTSSFTQSGSANVLIGQLFLGTTGGVGNYTISGTGNNLTLTPGGDFEIGNGTFTQNDASSTVDLSGANTIEMGLTSGDTAIYNLEAGTLNMSDTILGFAAGANATFNQSGGTFTSSGTFQIGADGTGSYNLSAGSADFQNGFTVGDSVGSTITQSGNSVLTAEGGVTIGGDGIGTYNLEGGTATFSGGLVVGATGTINQTGGVLIIANGQTLDLSAAGSSYTVGGNGVLQIANTGLVGTSGEGTLNFAGGTLRITNGGAFTDALDGTLSGTSTIDAVTTPGVTDVTFSGNLSGPGGITFEGTAGTTVFQFAGTNSYTGPTTIESGTLNAAAADIADSSALNIGATGVLNLTLANGGFAYAGALGGSGALNVNFNTAGDPFVVKNTSSYTGPITLGANGTSGVLQVYSGTYGDISDNGTGSGVTIGGAPLAAFPAGVAVPASGTVTFGNTTYTGTTTINSGFILNANNLDGPVTDMGALFTLGAGTVTNTGTLGLLQSSAVGSTLNINGSLTSTGADAALEIRANGTLATPVADLILASNTVTLDSASKIVVIGTGNITTPIAIVTGEDGLTVAPGALPEVDSTLLFHATLARDGNSIDLTTVQTPVSSFALTPNEAAAAIPIDQAIGDPARLSPAQLAAFNPVLLAFNRFTVGSEVANALEQLTPESLQYSRMIAFENSTFLVQRMNGIDENLRGSYEGLDTSGINVIAPGFTSSLGRSLGSLLAYNDPAFHQSAPNGVNYYPGGSDETAPAASSSSAPTWNSSSQVISDSPNPYLSNQNPSGPEAPAMGMFISGDAVLADLNQNQSAANAPSSKASYTGGDATAGISFRMNSHLAAGVLFDYNHTDAKTDSSGSETHVDSYSPGLFATYFDHGFYANGLFSFGYNNYSNTRNIGFLGESASSHPDGRQYVGDLDVGYDFHPDRAWVVGPTLGITYTHLDIDSFTESGAPGADLAVDSQMADSVRSRLGGHAVFQTNTGDVLLQPNITAMWQHEYLNDSSGIESTFNDFSTTPFSIRTAAPSRDSALIGVGLTATLSNSMVLYLNYLADVGADNYIAQSVVGGLKARF